MERSRLQRLQDQVEALQRITHESSADDDDPDADIRGEAPTSSPARQRRRRAETERAPLLVRAMGRGANCRWANRHWSKYTGRSPDRTLGGGWLKDVHVDDRARCAHADVSASDGMEFCELEYRLRRATGGYAWVHEHRVPRLRVQGGGVGYLATAVDVSSRKCAELHLDLVYAAERVLAQDGSVVEQVDAILELLCRRLAWDVAELWSCAVPNERARCLRRWSSDGAETPETLEAPERPLDSPAFDADVEAVWVEDIAEVGAGPASHAARAHGLHGMLQLPVPMHGPAQASLRLYSRDVRDRDEAVIAVAASVASRLGQALERQLPNGIPQSTTPNKTAFLDRLPDALVSIDREGRVLEINPEAEALFGFSPGHALGRSFLELVVPRRARKHFLEHVKEQWAFPYRGIRGAHFDSSARKADGKLFAVRYFMTTLTDHDPPCLTICIHDDTARKRAEDAAAHQFARARSLMGDLLLVEEHERKRLASDLHDGLSQTIALAQIKLSALRTARLSANDESLDEIQGLLEQADRAARSVGFELSPLVLHDLGLEPALEWLIENIHDRYGTEVELQCDGQVPKVEETARVILFRAIRELLINAAKHADAQHVRVHLNCRRRRLHVVVTDDGVGMSPDSALTEGFGLLSTRERMSHIGGRMIIESTPGEGTRVRLSTPLRTRPPQERRTEL